MTVRSVVLENVRCFASRVDVPLAPLTLLVGENSTGKSTFLGMVRVAWDIVNGTRNVDFNEPPFSFGTYDHIARQHGGRAQIAKQFSIGLAVSNEAAELESSVKVVAQFIKKSGQPQLREISVTSADGYEIHVKYAVASSPDESASIAIKTPTAAATFNTPSVAPLLSSLPVGIPAMEYLLFFAQRLHQIGKTPPVESTLEQKDLQKIQRMLVKAREHVWSQRPVALAPIRTEPLRTYEPGHTSQTPDGYHVPALLSTLFRQQSPRASETLQILQDVGRKAGLFESIRVRHLGSKPEVDPFQVHLKIRKQSTQKNLVDVGYGVSQALPLIVDSLNSDANAFLVQQPEVHLHPRAQAEIGSFLAQQVTRRGQHFVVETHSDYLVDRVCSAVRERSLKPEDVIILSFSHRNLAVEVDPIRVDPQGNLVDAPEGYRDFFMREQRRSLGL